MKKVIRLTEGDLVRIVRKIVKESDFELDVKWMEFYDDIENLIKEKYSTLSDVKIAYALDEISNGYKSPSTIKKEKDSKEIDSWSDRNHSSKTFSDLFND